MRFAADVFSGRAVQMIGKSCEQVAGLVRRWGIDQVESIQRSTMLAC